MQGPEVGVLGDCQIHMDTHLYFCTQATHPHIMPHTHTHKCIVSTHTQVYIKYDMCKGCVYNIHTQVTPLIHMHGTHTGAMPHSYTHVILNLLSTHTCVCTKHPTYTLNMSLRVHIQHHVHVQTQVTSTRIKEYNVYRCHVCDTCKLHTHITHLHR